MTRTLASPDSVMSTPAIPTRRRRTKEEMAAAQAEVEGVLAEARAKQDLELITHTEPVAKEEIIQIPDAAPTPPLDNDFQAEVIEFHQPIEIMGNQKTLSSQRSLMTRLSDGTGDWLIQSKKTKHRYLLGSGNMKAAKLK